MRCDVFIKQRGSVLIVALVVLLVLTLLGISGMDTTVMQERMASNMQEGLSSFQAAEAGLRDGEADARDTLSLATVFKSDCTNGLCEPADPSTSSYDVWVTTLSSDVYWHPSSASSDRNTRRYGASTTATALQNVSRQPAYIVERLQVVERGGSVVTGFANKSSGEWYRITARGFGRNGQSQTTLQSVIRK